MYFMGVNFFISMEYLIFFYNNIIKNLDEKCMLMIFLIKYVK